MNTKDLLLEVKSLSDDGSFEGYASVFGVLDLDNEVVDRGAFKRSIDHSNGRIPILWQHDKNCPIGWNMEMNEDTFGLLVKGRLLINTEKGRHAYEFMKAAKEAGASAGLSIGFRVPKDGEYRKEGVRHFREIALREYSVVTFPANERAMVADVKSEIEKMDFTEALERTQLMAMRYQLLSALSDSLDTTLYESNDAESKLSAVELCIDQFRSSYLEFVPRLLAAWKGESEEEVEFKAGRVLSEKNIIAVRAAIDSLQALLTAAESSSEPGKSHSGKQASNVGDSDDLHSLVKTLRSTAAIFKAAA